MNTDAGTMTAICIHASNDVFVFMLERVDRRTGAMLRC